MTQIITIKRLYLKEILLALLYDNPDSTVGIKIENWEITFTCIYKDISTSTTIQPYENLVAAIEDYKCTFRNPSILINFLINSTDAVINIVKHPDSGDICFGDKSSTVSFVNTSLCLINLHPPADPLDEFLYFIVNPSDINMFVKRLTLLCRVNLEVIFNGEGMYSRNDYTYLKYDLPHIVNKSIVPMTFNSNLILDFFRKIKNDHIHSEPMDSTKVYLTDLMTIIYGNIRFYVGPLEEVN